MCNPKVTLTFCVFSDKLNTVKHRLEGNLDSQLFDRILSSVEKPARYMGGELNMTTKKDAELRLLFPMFTRSACRTLGHEFYTTF